MEVGTLYKVINHWWAVYPTIKNLNECGHTAIVKTDASSTKRSLPSKVLAEEWARYWSRSLNCEVKYIEQDELFVCLELQPIPNKEQSYYVKVIATSGTIGWIYNTPRRSEYALSTNDSFLSSVVEANLENIT